MKTVAMILALVAVCFLGGCETGSTTSTQADTIAPRGTPLGNSSVRVSGDIEAGGAVRAR